MVAKGLVESEENLTVLVRNIGIGGDLMLLNDRLELGDGAGVVYEETAVARVVRVTRVVRVKGQAQEPALSGAGQVESRRNIEKRCAQK